MKTKPSKSKLLSSIFFGLLFLLSPAMNYAETGRKTHSSNLNWLNFSLKGGFAHSESRSGMVDVMAEIQYILQHQPQWIQYTSGNQIRLLDEKED